MRPRHLLRCCLLAVCWLAAPGVSAQTPPLGGLVVDGARAIAEQRFVPLYAEYLGTEFTAADRRRLQAAVITLYRDRGYPAPAVSLRRVPGAPAIWRLRVREARLVAVVAEGLGAAGNRRLERLAGPLADAGRFLHDELLERVVQRLERLAARDLQYRVEPVAGTARDYRLVLAAWSRLEGEVTLSTEGSDRIGRELGGAGLTLYNPAGGIASASLSALGTLDGDGFRSAGIATVLAPGFDDRVRLDASAARAEPRDTADVTDVYRRQRYRAVWRHRLTVASRLERALTASVTVRDYTLEREGNQLVDERLRVVGLGVEEQRRWPGRALRWRLEARQGIAGLGARREGPAAVRGTDLDFSLAEAGLTAWQVLPLGSSLRLDIGAQISDDVLPFSQRFSVGGSRFARAYEPGELSGDRGAAGRLELRRGFDVGTTARLVPYAYYGIGVTERRDTGHSASAASAGGGLRWIGERLSAYIELGVPLTRASDYRGDDARAMGRVTLRLP